MTSSAEGFESAALHRIDAITVALEELIAQRTLEEAAIEGREFATIKDVDRAAEAILLYSHTSYELLARIRKTGG